MIRKSGNRSCGMTTLNWNSDGARVSNEALRIGWKKLIIMMASNASHAALMAEVAGPAFASQSCAGGN